MFSKRMMMPGQFVKLIWELWKVGLRTPPLATFCQIKAPATSLRKMHILPGFWTAVLTRVFAMKRWNSYRRPISPCCKYCELRSIIRVLPFQRPGCSLFAGWHRRKTPDAELEARGVHHGDRRSLWMRAGWERQDGYRIVLLLHKRQMWLTEETWPCFVFSSFICLMEAKSTAICFLHIPNQFSIETLEQLQKFVQVTFLKGCAVSTATGKRMWSPVVKKEHDCLPRKDWEEVKTRYTSPSSLIAGYMQGEGNVCTAKSGAKLDLRSEMLQYFEALDDCF